MEFTFYRPNIQKYFDCPLCNSRLYEGSSYCECKIGEEYLYNGTYYMVSSLEPWEVSVNYLEEDILNWESSTQEPSSMTVVGGPTLVYAVSTYIPEPKYRVPNRWKGARGRDDLRQSWGKTFGGLKGSSLRARGTWRK